MYARAMIRPKYALVLCAIITIGFLCWVYNRSHTPVTQQLSNPNLPVETIHIGTVVLSVEVASSDAQREQGLSDRTSLAEGQGMLFVFAPAKPVGFWMKDMHFALDMIFATEDGVIVKIDTDVSPDTYPNLFRSNVPVRYVLEVPAGYSKKAGIAVGQKIVVQ
jgi:uncharacterized membrane protein (UPF0127 family)